MKRVLKIIEENYPAFVLIILFSLYEYWLMHWAIYSITVIFNKTIQRPYQIDPVSDRINYCVFSTIIHIVIYHIPQFIFILIMKYLAKCSPPFNKKVFITMCIATTVSMIITFCLRLYGDLWLFRVI
jgi:uncharacterized membrane protein